MTLGCRDRNALTIAIDELSVYNQILRQLQSVKSDLLSWITVFLCERERECV